ncbi:hypothetical protein D3P06_18300 [Paracoccus aestuarii]|uniref:Uncharacterized protein n=2 Tax=Paracoccus aestuarii TaxID=453842 RepID=A0A418ZP80_9RHOB|nr:hypothetical protein D3P06_18300 [Paracoccus aestuarii]
MSDDVQYRGGPNMMILVLILAVAGAFTTSVVLFALGASLGAIILGYIAGGWVAVVFGGGLLALWRLFTNTASLKLVPLKG